jgi:5'-phosphate synthase pdxT subunit
MILLADRILDGTADQQAIGGLDVAVRRNAFGRQVDSFEGDVSFGGFDDGPVHAVFIRASTAVRSRSSGAGPGEAAGRIVAVRQGDLLATAFHPELTGDPRVHALFVAMVKGTS